MEAPAQDKAGGLGGGSPRPALKVQSSLPNHNDVHPGPGISKPDEPLRHVGYGRGSAIPGPKCAQIQAQRRRRLQPRFWRFATKVPDGATNHRVVESKQAGSASKPTHKVGGLRPPPFWAGLDADPARS